MKHLRAISVAMTAAVVGLGMSGTATAAVSPHSVTACTLEPTWEASTPVRGTPVIDHEYTLVLQGGTFYAEWSSAWNLAVKYVKSSGTISGTFEYFDINTNEDSSGALHQSCGWGSGSDTFSAQSSPSYIFSGSAQPPKPYNDIVDNSGTEQEVVAVMYIPSENHYYAISFAG